MPFWLGAGFLSDIPRHGQRQPSCNALRGDEAQLCIRFADVDKAVAHVACSEVTVDGIGDGLPRFAHSDGVARDD